MMRRMTRYRGPSRTLVIAMVVAGALICAIVYFGLNPDPVIALIAALVFVLVGVVGSVFDQVHYLRLTGAVVKWLEDRRRGGDDTEPGRS